MKNIFLILLLIGTLGCTAQNYSANNVNIRTSVRLYDWTINRFQRDTNFASHYSIPTSLAIKQWVEGRMAGITLAADTATLTTRLRLKNTLDSTLNLTAFTILGDVVGYGGLHGVSGAFVRGGYGKLWPSESGVDSVNGAVLRWRDTSAYRTGNGYWAWDNTSYISNSQAAYFQLVTQKVNAIAGNINGYNYPTTQAVDDFVSSGLASKLNLSDTANMLINYVRRKELSDTAAALRSAIASGGIAVDAAPTSGSTNAVSSGGVFNALATKLNIADTAAMLSPYARAANVYNKTQSDGRYLQSFTETDPTVPSVVKAITSTDISNWNGKQNAIGYTPENIINKATTLTFPDNIKYPTTQAVVNALASKMDTSAKSTLYVTGGGIYMFNDSTVANRIVNATDTGSVVPAMKVQWDQAWNKFTQSGTYASGTITFTRNDGTTYTVPGLPTGSGVTDGNKGDITISGTGTVYKLNPFPYNGDIIKTDVMVLDTVTNTYGRQKMAHIDMTGFVAGNLVKFDGTNFVRDPNSYLTSFTETDPTVPAAVKAITSTDISNWNGKQTQLNGTGFVKASGATISYDNSTYLTGNQNITISGDVSGSGSTAITATIGANKVTNTMLAQAAANTLRGNNTGGTANVSDLTASQVKTMLAITASDVSGLPVTASGTYVPTIYAVANGTIGTIYTFMYSRVGSIVTVSGKVYVTPTASGTVTQFEITIPVASAFSAGDQALGALSSNIGQSGFINSNLNGRVIVGFLPTTTQARDIQFTFQYRIL